MYHLADFSKPGMEATKGCQPPMDQIWESLTMPIHYVIKLTKQATFTCCMAEVKMQLAKSKDATVLGTLIAAASLEVSSRIKRLLDIILWTLSLKPNFQVLHVKKNRELSTHCCAASFFVFLANAFNALCSTAAVSRGFFLWEGNFFFNHSYIKQ